MSSAPAASEPAAPQATAEAGSAERDRRPVRVIEGVTPVPGGSQASPAPQNNLEGEKPSAAE
ncbi:MAG: hypothetical protein JO048_11745 [Methylobacteriaceae bacterium]|nr:hypothetical protein [Methylobacteriaceae bacterium]